MDLTKKNIEGLLTGSFTNELIEITLTQQVSESPEVFSGSGFVYYKNNSPYIKFLHKEVDPHKKATATYHNLSYGQIIEDKYLFSLMAVDLDGNLWCAKNVDPYVNMRASQQGISIDCEVDQIISESRFSTKKCTAFFVTPNKINIPCNQFQDLGEGGKRRAKSVFELGEIRVTILLENKYTSFCFESNDVFSYEYAIAIIDSFSIASGFMLSPALVVWLENDIKKLTYKYISNHPKIRLMEFIPPRNPLHQNDWVQFSQAYITKIGVDKTLYYYWLKVFNAHQSDLENETLSLTVSIEGVVNKFYSDFKADDVEFSNLCGESKHVIEVLDINERVKGSIISLLERSGKSSIKGTLFNMADMGIFPRDLAKTWFKARNRSAHAEHFKKHAWQENLSNYSSCLTLFYILLSYHIGYTGMFSHYHLPGAPLQKLPFIKYDK
ncbi:hypothetical protein B9D02_04775 [Pantoea vagans]|nr:hypothetical protein [Pantoea vagans]AWP31927.1 hypothetical protein B9D02_04775 [Pantoea vagans]